MNKTNSDAFLDALAEIDGGLFLQEIGDKLAEVVKACTTRRKKGGIQISLGLKPNSRGQVEVVARVDSALPKSDAFGGIFFGTEQGLLQRRDPRQPELPGIEREEVEEDFAAVERRNRSRAEMLEETARRVAAKSDKIVPIAPSASA